MSQQTLLPGGRPRGRRWPRYVGAAAIFASGMAYAPVAYGLGMPSEAVIATTPAVIPLVIEGIKRIFAGSRRSDRVASGSEDVSDTADRSA